MEYFPSNLTEAQTKYSHPISVHTVQIKFNDTCPRSTDSLTMINRELTNCNKMLIKKKEIVIMNKQ